MNRDLVCCARLLLDSLPAPIRNSKFLFRLASLVFHLPDTLFEFREIYRREQIADLSIFYDSANCFSLPRVSSLTDINSRHFALIHREYELNHFDSVLDIGCGTGYLLNTLLKKNFGSKGSHYCGVDFEISSFQKLDSEIQYIEGDLLTVLRAMPDSYFQFVICSHVLEHLVCPLETLSELRRVCSSCLIVVCPLEKEYHWGLNYHVNFFPTSDHFLKFVEPIDQSLDYSSKYFLSLGDIMYVQYLL